MACAVRNGPGAPSETDRPFPLAVLSVVPYSSRELLLHSFVRSMNIKGFRSTCRTQTSFAGYVFVRPSSVGMAPLDTSLRQWRRTQPLRTIVRISGIYVRGGGGVFCGNGMCRWFGVGSPCCWGGTRQRETPPPPLHGRRTTKSTSIERLFLCGGVMCFPQTHTHTRQRSRTHLPTYLPTHTRTQRTTPQRFHSLTVLVSHRPDPFTVP
jgi:hypothetical protein